MLLSIRRIAHTLQAHASLSFVHFGSVANLISHPYKRPLARIQEPAVSNMAVHAHVWPGAFGVRGGFQHRRLDHVLKHEGPTSDSSCPSSALISCLSFYNRSLLRSRRSFHTLFPLLVYTYIHSLAHSFIHSQYCHSLARCLRSVSWR